jgi:spermidine/putrescine transport system permease protein
MNISKFISAFFSFVLAFFLISPIILVVLFSFSDRALANFPINNLTFKWWIEIFNHRQFMSCLINSITIGISVALVSSITGTMAAIGLSKMPNKSASLILAVISIPIMLPPLVLGISLLSFYVSIGMKLGLHTVIISHLLFTQPFVILIVYSRMITFDYSVIDSARDLGASPLKAFLTITVPIIQPVVIGASLLAVALSVDDFIITFFTIGAGNTLPTLVFGMMRTSLRPSVNAIGTIILFMTISSSIIALWITRYRG